jgi:hypothetical protein
VDRFAYTLVGCVGVLFLGCAHVPVPEPLPPGCIDVAFAGTELQDGEVYACGIVSDGRFACVTLREFLGAMRSQAPEGRVDL